MYIGVDYYPEFWPEDHWERDTSLMQEAGFNVVRMAEFAWGVMEPEEGKFEFAWLDRILDLLNKQGIKAVLCTPTASMPPWVAHNYPEVVATDFYGQKLGYGRRKDYCLSSSRYRSLSRSITRAMAEHFKDHPAVIGWQTDNEFGEVLSFCYCETCRSAFGEWLRARYGTLEALNNAWGTRFWGHIYQEWEEIPLPRCGLVDGGDSNNSPSIDLDFRRFYSDKNVDFQREQVEILRETCPDHFVTHNLMGCAPHINYFDLAKDLDFVGWDNHPAWLWSYAEDPADAAANADLMRGVKKKNFWIMETPSGTPGSGAMLRALRPGEMRSLAYQQVAHGADGYLWFRWHSCLGGREQYWHGILGHSGEQGRQYREAREVAAEFHKIESEIDGSGISSDVAIIFDYDSLWALTSQPSFANNDYVEHYKRYYGALFRAGVSVDFVSKDSDFSDYRIVIAPQLFVLPDSSAKNLVEFVRNGGILLSDLRTGVKDESNLCRERVLPGLLGEVCGVRIEEYEALPPNVKPRLLPCADVSGSFTSVLYADWITPAGAEVLFRYDEDYLSPYAAVTRNTFGDGIAYYVGTICEERSFYDTLISEALKKASVESVVVSPENVEVGIRQKDGDRYVFLVNHGQEPATVGLPFEGEELLTNIRVADSITLNGHGIAVIKC